jgi:SAM-dependent methyltransferase
MTTFKELELHGWQERASQYDAGAGRMTRNASTHLLDAVEARAPMALLDVCCGPGYNAGGAAARGCTATGVDLAPAMVDEARRRFPAATFATCDAEALAFPDRSFDAVICGFGILHLPEPEKAIVEAFRVLRPGGRYAWTVWCGPERAQLSGIAQHAIAAHADMNVPMPPAPPREQFSDAAAARAALEAAGFVDVRSEELPLIWRGERPEDVWEWYDRGTVRTAALLNLQTAAVRERIRAAIVAEAARFRTPDGIVVPNYAIMHVARKP